MCRAQRRRVAVLVVLAVGSWLPTPTLEYDNHFQVSAPSSWLPTPKLEYDSHRQEDVRAREKERAAAVTREYEAQRALAEKQAENAVVAAYRTQVAGDLEPILSKTLVHCTRQQFQPRRERPSMVLTIAADGEVTDVAMELTRMGSCTASAVKGIRLSPPPTAPLRITIEGLHRSK